MKLSMELCGNNTERVKQNYSKQNLFQCPVVHHESRMDWLGIEPGPLLLKTKNETDFPNNLWLYIELIRYVNETNNCT